jgi:hypothetical protein
MGWWLQYRTTHRERWFGKGGARRLAPCSPFLLFRFHTEIEQIL